MLCNAQNACIKTLDIAYIFTAHAVMPSTSVPMWNRKHKIPTTKIEWKENLFLMASSKRVAALQ